MTSLARRILPFCLTIAIAPGLASLSALPARAQDSQHIAAVVNDDIISAFDLEQRITLALASSGAPNTPEQRARARDAVLRGLIDETLQNQAAKAKGVEVSDAEVSDAIGRIAAGNNVPVEKFDAFLSQAGVARATLERQIRTQLAWQKLVGKELGPRIAVGQDAIDATMARLKASIGKPELLVSEIFLPVDTSVDDPQVKAQADRIVDEVRKGTPFRLLARQYSQATTAATGGDLGWVPMGQLPEEVEATLDRMQVNSVSDPIRAGGGYYIVGLRDRRQLSGLDPSLVKLDLRQMVFNVGPVPASAGTAADPGLQAAKQASAELKSCADLEQVAQRHGAVVKNEPGQVTLADVNAGYRPYVEPLAANQVSTPIKNGNSYLLIVVCNRENPTSSGPSRETVTDQLENAQLNMMARRYLRDLRRDATIEMR
jgi:peptidyl-prolyl cis-trans isomerase SurA